MTFTRIFAEDVHVRGFTKPNNVAETFLNTSLNNLIICEVEKITKNMLHV